MLISAHQSHLDYHVFFVYREVSENDVELISYSYLLSAYLMLNGSKAG